ncbi:MAG: PTS glucose transporter subunit IIA [Solobacterium sp.]|nr:PTS glucose transporter subunit IIA [Solobacterium sp.]
MFNFFKKKEEICALTAGKLIGITEVKDQVFSQKLMGDGYAIIPENGIITAPSSGSIKFCFPTNHAVGLVDEEGREYLIHMGLDTVELKGEGFKKFIENSQKVKQGDKLMEMDLDLIKSKGYDCTVIVVYPKNSVELNEKGTVAAGQKLNIKIK